MEDSKMEENRIGTEYAGVGEKVISAGETAALRRETAEKPRKTAGREKERDAWMHLEIDSHSSNEEFARVTAAVFMSRMNPTMEELEDVKTAVSEAVTNAVIHGYGEKIGIIYIEAQIEGNQLTISIRDEGKGIPDVEKAMEPMYTTDTTGERSGMGFSFMEAFMDEVEVESEAGHGTCVTMRKWIQSGKCADENKNKEEKNRKDENKGREIAEEDLKNTGMESFYG